MCGIRELTIGTPVANCAEPLEDGWVEEVACEMCNQPMRCLEINSKPKNEGDTVTYAIIVCLSCLSKLQR